MQEVQGNTGSQQMFRSLGRMFILCDKEELVGDLTADMARMDKE